MLMNVAAQTSSLATTAIPCKMEVCKTEIQLILQFKFATDWGYTL